MEKNNFNRIYNNKKLEDKIMRKNRIKFFKIAVCFIYTVIFFILNSKSVFGADDPLTVINNLSTFIFGLIRAVGMIILGFGIVQVGLSLKSHDPAQRANGVMTVAGGVIITFAKEILNLITGG